MKKIFCSIVILASIATRQVKAQQVASAPQVGFGSLSGTVTVLDILHNRKLTTNDPTVVVTDFKASFYPKNSTTPATFGNKGDELNPVELNFLKGMGEGKIVIDNIKVKSDHPVAAPESFTLFIKQP